MDDVLSLNVTWKCFARCISGTMPTQYHAKQTVVHAGLVTTDARHSTVSKTVVNLSRTKGCHLSDVCCRKQVIEHLQHCSLLMHLWHQSITVRKDLDTKDKLDNLLQHRACGVCATPHSCRIFFTVLMQDSA